MFELSSSTPASIHPSATRCREQARAGKLAENWLFDADSGWNPRFQAVAKIHARMLHVRKTFVGSGVCMQGRKN